MKFYLFFVVRQALRHEETWIGRGSFPLSPAAEVLCSRKQACIQFDTSGWRIECHGLNPLYFVVCQHANFDATQVRSVLPCPYI